MGFFQELYPIARGISGARGEIYGGVLGRMAISARGILPSIRQGSEFYGFSPKSLRLSKFGWISDTIGYRDITGFMDESWKEKVNYCLRYLLYIYPKYALLKISRKYCNFSHILFHKILLILRHDIRDPGCFHFLHSEAIRVFLEHTRSI